MSTIRQRVSGRPESDSRTQAPPLARSQLMGLFLIPPLAALGPWASFTPGAELSPYFLRILLILLLVPALRHLSTTSTVPNVIRSSIWAAVVLIGWGLVGLLWTPEVWVGFRDVSGILLGFLTVCVMLGLTRGNALGISAIRWGFLAALISTGAVALWEIRTGSHLREFSIGTYGFRDTATSSTFINPNNFGAFLLGTIGPCIILVARMRKLIPQVSITLMILGAGFLAVNTESRGAVFGTLIILTLGLLALAVFDIGYFITASLIATPVAIITSLIFDSQIRNVLDTITTQSDAASDAVRIQLLKQAISSFSESFGIGTGPGSYLATLAADPERLTPITPAHNTLAQVAAEYGVPGLLAMLVILFGCISVLFPPRHVGGLRLIQFELVLCFAALSGASLIASSVLGDPSWWVLIGYMLCLTWQFRSCETNLNASERVG